jgi:hypothetical protein
MRSDYLLCAGPVAAPITNRGTPLRGNGILTMRLSCLFGLAFFSDTVKAIPSGRQVFRPSVLSGLLEAATPLGACSASRTGRERINSTSRGATERRRRLAGYHATERFAALCVPAGCTEFVLLYLDRRSSVLQPGNTPARN